MVISTLVAVNTQNIYAWKIGVPNLFGGKVNFSIPMYGRVLTGTITSSSGSAGAKVNINFLLSNYKWNIYKDGVFFTSSSASGTLISPTVSYTKTTSGSGSFDATLYMGHLTGSFTPTTQATLAEYTIYFYGKTTLTATRTGFIYFDVIGVSGVNASNGGAFGNATNGTLTYLPATFPTYVSPSLTVATPTVSSGTILGNILKGSQLILPTGGQTIKLGSNSYVYDNANNLTLRTNSYINLFANDGIVFGTNLLQSLFGSYTAPTWNGSTITSATSGYYYLPYNNSNRILIQFGASIDRATTSITFPIGYVSIPYVFGQVYNGGAKDRVSYIVAVSSSAFTFESVHTNTDKASFNWLAIGLKQN